ncbi:hypothetical protein ACPZ19_36545 [Amycolatopsis lurida]
MIASRSSLLVEVLAAADNDGVFADLNQADSSRCAWPGRRNSRAGALDRFAAMTPTPEPTFRIQGKNRS